MGIGISLLLIAAGAVLIWAVDLTVHGVNLVTVGWILLIIGGNRRDRFTDCDGYGVRQRGPHDRAVAPRSQRRG
jgi:hypothetical protein